MKLEKLKIKIIEEIIKKELEELEIKRLETETEIKIEKQEK